MRTILYTDQVTEDIQRLMEECLPEDFKLLFWMQMDKKQREKALPLVDYLLVGGEEITADWIQKSKRLRHIQRTGVGVNNIDIKTADLEHITVSNQPGINKNAVADHAVLLTMALMRNLVNIDSDMKAGQYPNRKYRMQSFEMEGKTVGLMGFGAIGRAAASRFRAFGMKVLYYDPYRAASEVEAEFQTDYCTKNDVLRQADVVSLHIPYTEENKNYIGKEELAMMKESAFLINVSRGGLVDEDALYEALKNGQIAGAGIDTWKTEPCTESPLFLLENVIATPHVAGGTRDTFRNQIISAYANIRMAEQQGMPKYTVGETKNCRFI